MSISRNTARRRAKRWNCSASAVERQEQAVKFSTRLVFFILLVTGAALGLLLYTRAKNY